MARKIVLKEDGLTGTSNTPSGYKYLGDSGGDISQKVGGTVSVIGGGSALAYSSYIGKFSQLGTDAPVVTVYENNIGSIVWTRVGTGSYEGTLAGAFSSGKVHLLFNNPLQSKIIYFYNTGNSNKVYIDCTSTVPAPADYNSDSLYIEIKVYP